MTEAEWLASEDPERMLQQLRPLNSDRKLRFFAVELFRRWHARCPRIQTRPAFANTIAVAERYLDGVATAEEVACAREALSAEFHRMGGPGERATAHSTCALAIWSRVQIEEAEKVSRGWRRTARWAFPYGSKKADRAEIQEAKFHSAILHDLIGNPFRPVAVDPSWLTSTVVALAGGIYEERAFDRLPILADALMDAGCDHADVLAHCRDAGPHVRGCWVVDLLLGKV